MNFVLFIDIIVISVQKLGYSLHGRGVGGWVVTDQ